MSDYDRNIVEPGPDRPNLAQPGLNSTGPDPVYRNRRPMNSNGWIGGAIVAVLIILALGYAFRGSYMGADTTEHRAAATDSTVAPPATAARPAPTASTQPK